MDTPFEKWLEEAEKRWMNIKINSMTLTGEELFCTRQGARQAWDAALQHARGEKLSCGHPKACWVDAYDAYEPNEDGPEGRMISVAGHCAWCSELAAKDAEIQSTMEGCDETVDDLLKDRAALRERLAAMREAFCKSAELHHRFGNKVGHPGEFTNCPNADCYEVRVALAVSGGAAPAICTCDRSQWPGNVYPNLHEGNCPFAAPEGETK